MASAQSDVGRAEPRQVHREGVPRSSRRSAPPARPPAARRAVRTGGAGSRRASPSAPVTARSPRFDDRDLLAGDRRDRRPEPVGVVQPHVRQHRDAAVPRVRRVEPPAEARPRPARGRARTRRSGGTSPRSAARTPSAARGVVATRSASGQHAVDQPGEVAGRDGPAVDHDPLAVGHEVGLGRLADAVPGGAQRRSGERDDAALAVRAGDERAADLSLRVAQRAQQRADPPETEADAVPAARLERGERVRVRARGLAAGPLGRLTRASARPRRTRTG